MSLSEEQVQAVWSYVGRACPDLLVMFDALDLRLSAARCAEEMELGGTPALDRWLKERHLPRYRTLRDWYYLTLICSRADQRGSLAALASERGDYPSILYRFAKHLSGDRWTAIQQLGVASVRRRCAEVWVAERPSLLTEAEA
jgi:hypothetical protein